MEAKRKSALLLTSVRNFRRILYCALGVVITSYLVLFVLVLSRHLDQTAQEELRKAAAQSLAAGSRTSERQNRGVPSRLAVGLGPSLLGMERFHERWAAVARVLRVDEADPSNPRRRVHICGKPVFRDPPGPMIALASFPGSGNTWVRFLVQQATGLLTGSVYRDYSLKRNGFPAESIANGSVLLVKTHEWGEKVRKKFQKAVLLIREPYGALMAEFNRRAGGHVGHASPEKFHRGNVWRSFALTHAKVWFDNTMDWLRYDGPLLILHYDIMKQDLAAELIKLLKFLDVNVTWSTFQCVLRNKDGIFRRAKRPLHFDPFDQSLRRVIEGYKSIVYTAVRLRERGIRFDENNATVLTGYVYNSNNTVDSASGGVAQVTYFDKAMDSSS